MHSFHSTVSRRDFMKTLGLAGAGVGAAAATFPVFHDLDELMSAPQAQHKQPWFVKDVDKPTIDIDWSQVVRSDKKINGHDGIPYLAPSGGWHATGDRIASYPGGDANRKPAEDYIKSKFPDWKGDTLRDQALRQTVWTVKRTPTPFVCSKLTYSPEEYGLPKYEGTPEENYVMIRNLLRFWGGGKIGVIKLDQDTRKVFNANSSNKDIVFEDVDEAYETTTKTVVPNKNEYLITALFTAQTVLGRRWPSLQSNAAVMGVYSFLSWAEGNLQEFLHGIGYEANVVDNITNSEPCGLVAGVGENVRMGYTVVSPETGAMARCMLRVITDLPLATTKPVDAGLNRFCNTCKICAEACPYNAIVLDDAPSWDNTAIPGSPPGFNGWRLKAMSCAHCGSACQAVCPFNAPRETWIHSLVAPTVTITPVFNKFFADMERAFGFGMWEPESFWTEDEQPIFGYIGGILGN
ncbi:MAG: hypothetical protein AMXMBFR85_11450 [Dehalococcoides mccartyi]|uniref:reductive dehalogenase n=1 Tax=Dehalococcoides mccartyi TaxID=61435 RepID=UPI002159F7CF|nr:reductive dehalogenase [Dehalococcoides mccartyi]MBA2084233.1 reductive dehalogenase [Dehalococcoides mccartyi]